MNKKKIVRHFISQCMHESGLGESISEADYLSKKAQKKWCAQYDFRADLGNRKKGDGYKYRGVGYLQVTGKTNQSKFANIVKISKIKSQGADYIVKHKEYLWAISTYWWHLNNMNALVNRKGVTVTMVTKRVNGGDRGLKERKKYYSMCKLVFY